MASNAEIAAMRRALALAQSPGVPLGPNPRVGAVIIDQHGVVAEGCHRGRGTPHAEVDALSKAGPRAKGATIVVTLEPCDHAGRTGPCSKAIIDAGVGRLVFAQRDHTPLAQGGSRTVAAAGIDVEGSVLESEAHALNRCWSFSAENDRPYVTWKYAATLDGRSAAADHSSQWITGPAARADANALRSECDAILVGTGTILADNPRLTVRDSDGAPLPRECQPLRAAMGLRSLDRDDLNFWDDSAPSLWITTHDLDDAMAALVERDCQHVWLEGGPTLATAFVAAGYVDRVIAYVAPILLGAGLGAIGDLGIRSIDDALRLTMTDATRIGNDVRITLEPQLVNRADF